MWSKQLSKCQLPPPTSQPPPRNTPAQRRSLPSLSSKCTDENRQLNRLRLKTPPPSLNSPSSTPSPPPRAAYSNNSSRQRRVERQGIVEGASNHPIPSYAQHSVYAQVGDASLERDRVETSNAHERSELPANELNRIGPFFDPGSSTETDSSSGGSSSENEWPDGRWRLHNRRRGRNQHSRIVREAYCPDLLNACSLILTNPRNSQRAHESNTSYSSSEHISDYVEIDDIPLVTSGAQRRLPDDHADAKRNLVQQAQSNPELRIRHVPATSTQQQQSQQQQQQQQRRDQQQCLSNAQVFPIRLAQERSLLEEEEQDDTAGNDDGGVNENGKSSILKNQRNQTQKKEMGQTLSLRRPRISLTWVLREQQQQQQQPQQQQPNQTEHNPIDEEAKDAINVIDFKENGNDYITGLDCRSHEVQSQAQDVTTLIKHRPKTKHSTSLEATELSNGYATTPNIQSRPVVAESQQKFFSNQNLLEYQEKRSQSKDTLLVNGSQRSSSRGVGACDKSETLAIAKRRNDIKKKFAARMALLQASNRSPDGAETILLDAHNHAPNGNFVQRDEPTTRSLKSTYSEPSLMAASEGNHRRHRHRKRRDRNRVPKFGYEIHNVEEFLAKCSLATPGNIPVVLSTSSTLYQTRPGGYQLEVPLPLGMVVNAVFKNQNWLYVQTPHAEEGYVGYASCLPLGILPPAARSGVANGNGHSTKPTPCWESNGDVFPHPCGNMTDSEKEIRLRGGTRSDGSRTPRGKRSKDPVESFVDARNGIALQSICDGEQRVDKLYLRAASQPKMAEKAYAQLRSTKVMMTTGGGKIATSSAATNASNSNDEYVVLQQQQKSKIYSQKQHRHQHHHQQSVHQSKQLLIKAPPITNGHNGQHLHPPNGSVIYLPRSSSFNNHQAALQAAKQFAQHSSQRQTLVAINFDYATDGICLRKGEIVTLCECRVAKDQRQWFYVKTRDGREGYIPAEVAGHGYL